MPASAELHEHDVRGKRYPHFLTNGTLAACKYDAPAGLSVVSECKW